MTGNPFGRNRQTGLPMNITINDIRRMEEQRRRGGNGGGGNNGGDGPRPPRPNFFNGDSMKRTLAMILGAVLIVWLLFSLMFMYPFSSSENDERSVCYGGGLFEERDYQGTLDPGTNNQFTGWGDHCYKYPTGQRNYIASEKKNEGDVAGGEAFVAPSKDRVQMKYQVAVYFKLNTNNLSTFHEDLGIKYKAWEDEGWKKMLSDSFRQQIQGSIGDESRKYDAQDLYASAEVREKLSTGIGSTLKANINRSFGKEYFCGVGFVHGKDKCPEFTFVIKDISPKNKGVIAAYEENKKSEIKVKSKENEIKQRAAEAKSIEELNAALEKSGPNYVLLKAIESGKIDFWVLPQGNNMTLQGPARK